MTSVTAQIETGTQITTVVARGQKTASDLRSALEEFYALSPTLLVLFDLSDAGLGALSSQQVRDLLEFTKRRGEVRRGGRTAIVASQDLEYGMARMYEILAEIHGHPVTIRAFRGREEATQWLQERV